MTSMAWRRAIDLYPYGKAPLSLLLIAILSTGLWFTLRRQREARPDLILVTFTAPHQEAYRKALPEFEQAHGVKVEVQLAQWESLQTRLQNAMLADTDVPDMVEMLEGSLGFFARGPQKDIGLLDLTKRVDEEQLRTRMVESRFSLWSARGRILGLPHDVHPVMLAYRRDLVEQLGIDVKELVPLAGSSAGSYRGSTAALGGRAATAGFGVKSRENEEGRSGEAAPRSGAESPAGLSASGTRYLGQVWRGGQAHHSGCRRRRRD